MWFRGSDIFIMISINWQRQNEKIMNWYMKKQSYRKIPICFNRSLVWQLVIMILIKMMPTSMQFSKSKLYAYGWRFVSKFLWINSCHYITEVHHALLCYLIYISIKLPHKGLRLSQHKQSLFTLGSRFGFCVVSERIHVQASRCVADRPLAVLTVLAEPDPVRRSGKKQTWGSIFKSHTL